MLRLPIITYLLIIFLTNISYAQSAADKLIDQLAKDACACVEKQKDFDKLSQEKMQTELGLCMMDGLSKDYARYEKGLNIKLDNQDNMTKLGEKIGLRMAVNCPQTILRLASSPAPAEDLSQPSETKTAQSVGGTISRIEEGEFSFIVLKDEQNREQKFLWLRYFTGSDSFIKDPKSIIGKKVKISYQALECYSPQAKDYFSRKEITGIEFVK